MCLVNSVVVLSMQHAHGQQQVLQCLMAVAVPAVAIHVDTRCMPSLKMSKAILDQTHFLIYRVYSCANESIVGRMVYWPESLHHTVFIDCSRCVTFLNCIARC